MRISGTKPSSVIIRLKDLYDMPGLAPHMNVLFWAPGISQ